jgi:hypothetical protein
MTLLSPRVIVNRSFSDSSLDKMLTYLVPTLNRNISPIPIPTFLGKDPVDRPLARGDSKVSQGEGSLKEVDPAVVKGFGV